MSQNTLERAVGLHGQGRLAEAQRIYEQILAANPDLLDARHMLGVLKAQQGHNSEAHDLIAPVVAANPGDVLARANFGNVLCALHRHAEALQNLDHALALALAARTFGAIAQMLCRTWDGWRRPWRVTTALCLSSRIFRWR